MKICPKCNAKYDDTWALCIKCNTSLQKSNIPPEILTELEALKSSLIANHTRIKNLEEKISVLDKKGGFVPQVEEKAAAASTGPIAKKQDIPAYQEDYNSDVKSFESKLGRVWFNRIGVLAIILGVAFFLKYAFDNNWIGPLGRVVMGLLAGVGLIMGGEYAHRRKYAIFAEGLLTGGTSILYLSIFAAVNLYKLMPSMAGFIFMAVVTMFAAVFSIRFDSPRVMTLTIIGGFLTPFIIFVSGLNPVLLMSYILILDVGILAVSNFKKWGHCNIAALMLTYFTYICWYEAKYSHEYFIASEAFVSAYFILFGLVAVIYNFIRKQESTAGDLGVVIFNALFYFMINIRLLTGEAVNLQHIGFFAIALAVLYFIFSYSAYFRTEARDKKLIFAYLSLTILFATVAIPMELKHHWVSIGFIIESALLIWLGFRTEIKGMRVTGLVLAGVTLAKLLFVDFSYAGYSGTLTPLFFIYNKRFFSYLVLMAGLYISAHLYQKNKNMLAADEKGLATALALCATFVLLVNLSLETDSYFNQLIYSARSKISGPYQLKLAGTAVLDNIRQFSLSAVWTVYSLVLIVIGIFRKFRALRIMALTLFILTILKVFLIDISAISRIWRILSFIGLGVVLVFTSFIYQKYKDKIFGLIKD